jgi:hypothetical protein
VVKTIRRIDAQDREEEERHKEIIKILKEIRDKMK